MFFVCVSVLFPARWRCEICVCACSALIPGICFECRLCLVVVYSCFCDYSLVCLLVHSVGCLCLVVLVFVEVKVREFLNVCLVLECEEGMVFVE